MRDLVSSLESHKEDFQIVTKQLWQHELPVKMLSDDIDETMAGLDLVSGCSVLASLGHSYFVED